MKKRDILISIAIIAVTILILFNYSRGRGYIQVDAGDAVAKLHLSAGPFTQTAIISGPEPVKVSVRAHRPRHLLLSMEQNGDKWQIEGNGSWGELSKISVKENETTTLKLGPPFLLKPTVRRSGSRVSINFDIVGRAGEKYQSYAEKNNRRIAAPKVKIINEAGNVLASGRFEYG